MNQAELIHQNAFAQKVFYHLSLSSEYRFCLLKMLVENIFPRV